MVMLEPQRMTNSDAQCLGALVGITHSMPPKLAAKPVGSITSVQLVMGWNVDGILQDLTSMT